MLAPIEIAPDSTEIDSVELLRKEHFGQQWVALFPVRPPLPGLRIDIGGVVGLKKIVATTDLDEPNFARDLIVVEIENCLVVLGVVVGSGND